MNCKTLLLNIAVATALLIAGCSSAPISVEITTPPPASLNINQTASIVATVLNDSSNSGVSWSCTPTGSCGSFNPAQTASGAMVTYTAPGAPGSVTLIAASVRNPAKTQSASVTINALPLSIAITTPPPASLEVNQSASIAATVTNDPANKGVDWSCTPTGSCGTFTPAHTASGAMTNYTAPGAPGPVTITAASTAQPSKTQQAMVNITPLPVLSIAITTPPPASLEVNLSTSIAATVTNDPANKGVDWSCAPTGTCGTFTPAHTASGAMTVYMAPRTAGPVTITAASTTQPATNKQAPVNITPVVTVGDLTGTYTFFVNGSNNVGFPYGVAGSVVLGSEKITGEQDEFSCVAPPAPCNVFPKDPIVSGSISVGADGRGSLSLHPASALAETFSITVVNNKHILLTQFDANAVADGGLDLQTAPSSVPSGGNAFAIFDTLNTYALGGVLTSSGTSITGSEVDDDIGGAANFAFALTCPCAITAPDAAGRGTIALTDPKLGTTLELAYYVVGPEAFHLIEFDMVRFSTGSMYGQGSGSFSAANLGKPFVFGQTGEGSSNGMGLGLWAAAGQFTGDGSSALSAGVADVNQGDGMPVKAGSLSGSSYFVKANGYGRIVFSGANTDGLTNFGIYLVDPAINVADPNNASGGGGGLMLDLDSSTVGIGITVSQTTGAIFTGNYAFDQGGYFQTTTTHALYGIVGQIVSTGTSLSGLADYNEFLIAQNPGVSVTGTTTVDVANPGRATSQVTINGAATPNNLTIYQASDGLLLDVDVDSTAAGLGNVGLGLIEQQQ
jgi:hypothetical protein